MTSKQLSREEAVEYLTVARGMFSDSVNENNVHNAIKILRETGNKVGYTPAFRCLIKGVSPEQSIRWQREGSAPASIEKQLMNVMRRR